MRSAIGLMGLNALNHNRAALNDSILKSVQKSVIERINTSTNLEHALSVGVLRYEITEVPPGAHISEAMDAQPSAERKHRETALNTDSKISVSQA